jgi:sulfate adenylyltransferase large subunit
MRLDKEKMKSMPIVIVGHVDHGKSTLIGRLFYDTGSLPKEKIEEIEKASKELGKEVEFAFAIDHLKEEREQEMTIDTAQLFFKTDKRGYVIIDAPGHKEFMRNMITGAAQAEAAVLIIDVSRGVEEQTKRHAYMLAMLGLKNIIVAINKMDLVAYSEASYNKVLTEAKELLSRLGLQASHFVPISAKLGDNIAKRSQNMQWFKDITLLEALDSLEEAKSLSEKSLRYAVQGMLERNGKRILVGRVESGEISAGQDVTFYPSGIKTSVRSIEVFGKKPTKATAGESIGIVVADGSNIARGEIACYGKEPQLKQEFEANIFWLASEPLKTNETLILRCATQERECKIKKIYERIDSASLEVLEKDAKELNETEVGKVLIECDKPLVLENFNEIAPLGRFVLLRTNNVCAGGIYVC